MMNLNKALGLFVNNHERCNKFRALIFRFVVRALVSKCNLMIQRSEATNFVPIFIVKS